MFCIQKSMFKPEMVLVLPSGLAINIYHRRTGTHCTRVFAFSGNCQTQIVSIFLSQFLLPRPAGRLFIGQSVLSRFPSSGNKGTECQTNTPPGLPIPDFWRGRFLVFLERSNNTYEEKTVGYTQQRTESMHFPIPGLLVFHFSFECLSMDFTSHKLLVVKMIIQNVGKQQFPIVVMVTALYFISFLCSVDRECKNIGKSA